MIYIPNLYEVMYNNGIESLSDLEKCILAMVDEDIEFSKKLVRGDDIMGEFVKDVKDASNNSRFMEAYTLEFRAEERGKLKGIEEGFEEGMEKGLQEGFKNGISQSKREMAKKMLKDNLSIEMIEKYTELSKEII